jgi:hypothetical protein
MNTNFVRRVVLFFLIGSAVGVASGGCSRVGDLVGTGTSTKYNQLQEGMTTAQVMAVMGQTTSESFNGSRTTTYTWKNSDGSSITASFQEDRLVSKRRGGDARRRQDARRLRRLLP